VRRLPPAMVRVTGARELMRETAMGGP